MAYTLLHIYGVNETANNEGSFMATYRLNDGTPIFIGKRKSTGKYIALEYRNGSWKDVGESDTFDGIRAVIRHRQTLADARARRQMIAEMCGTSYRAAMADMGMSQ
jgi:hypothetical protein